MTIFYHSVYNVKDLRVSIQWECRFSNIFYNGFIGNVNEIDINDDNLNFNFFALKINIKY